MSRIELLEKKEKLLKKLEKVDEQLKQEDSRSLQILKDIRPTQGFDTVPIIEAQQFPSDYMIEVELGRLCISSQVWDALMFLMEDKPHRFYEAFCKWCAMWDGRWNE